MKRTVLDVLRPILAGGRAAALLAVAVLAGAVGGAWAVSGAPGLDRVTFSTVADSSQTPSATGSTAGESAEPKKSKEPKAERSGRPEDAGKPSKAPKVPKAGSLAGASGAHGLHGKCVSQVARSDATGGPNHNHGGAVSAAAKNCPRPAPAASGAD
jgi:hypothetical protein